MACRRRLIAGNWKMHKTTSEAKAFAERFLAEVQGITGVDMVICAPFTALAALQDELAESVVHLGAQDLFWASEGAYTGEISPRMLADLACTYVIVGHSERREILGETDELIGKKVKAALAAGLAPILCVGENLAQREAGRALQVVRGQVERDLADIPPEDLPRLVIAYEPIWAIGTGKTASSSDTQEMCAAIRSSLAGIAGALAGETRILYGGSVKPGNISDLMRQPDVDGALVGGASLDPLGFSELIKNALID